MYVKTPNWFSFLKKKKCYYRFKRFPITSFSFSWASSCNLDALESSPCASISSDSFCKSWAVFDNWVSFRPWVFDFSVICNLTKRAVRNIKCMSMHLFTINGIYLHISCRRRKKIFGTFEKTSAGQNQIMSLFL